jgi:hypothetical protein
MARNRVRLLIETNQKELAIAARIQLLEIDHARYATWSTELADALIIDATALLDAARPAEAVEPLREAVAIRQKYPQPEWKLAQSQSLLGAAIADSLGNTTEAEQLLITSTRTLQTAAGAPAGLAEVAQDRLAAFYDDQHRPADAARVRAKQYPCEIAPPPRKVP